ncbi:MAG: hypothetical protein E3J83_03315 [Candidatus Atribacteria bacterium]|nr:MAG: hypothetical protein E3J83_03315 [Candidatus Atribacteria bacterium]
MVIYLICNKNRPISMIKSGEEPEDFIKRKNRGKKPKEFLKMGNEKTVVILTRKDIEDIIRLGERG